MGEAGYTLLQRNWVRPTLEFNGISGGYGGPGKKTVIPAFAQAKLTCRLVPDQEPDVVASQVARFVKSLAPPGVAVEIKVETGGASPYAVPSQHPGLTLAETVLAEVGDVTPIRVRMGATIPIGGIFKRVLGWRPSSSRSRPRTKTIMRPTNSSGCRAWRTD